MRRAAIAAFSAGLVLAAAGEAGAYIIGAKSVFRRFAEKQALDRATSGTLAGRATVAIGTAEGEREAPVRVETTLPSQCELTLELPDGNVGGAFRGGKVTTSGPAPAGVAAYLALGCPLATLKRVPATDAENGLAKYAEALGVDLATVSLSRLGRRPAYVVGARPQERDRPQIWFDKETTRPIRVIADYAGESWDVRFEDSASPATGKRHPRVVEVYRGGRRALALRLMAADEGASAAVAGDDAEDEAE